MTLEKTKKRMKIIFSIRSVDDRGIVRLDENFFECWIDEWSGLGALWMMTYYIFEKPLIVSNAPISVLVKI